MVTICEICAYYQESRNPYGCFKGHDKTDLLSRVKRTTIGCKKFGQLQIPLRKSKKKGAKR
jgi:hypothetical protein